MRFQAELPRRDAAILQALIRELDVHNNAELMAHLLSIATWAVSERRQGRRVASLGHQGPVRELVSPLLERAAPEHELPYVEIDWTPQQSADLAALLSSEPAEPTERLVRIMNRR